jgi:phage-related protein
MKVIRFLGDSRKLLREFPKDARQEAGYQLERIQSGLSAQDFKPMHAIGAGVEEIRISEGSGVYRVVYTARLAEAVYVIHAFQKKTRATSQRDIEIARQRFRQLIRGRI